jgi:ParB family chromosome partitioning protein
MFTIIAGERRFRAARLAGLAEVPVVLLDAGDDHHLLELALVENLQRQDLNPLEAAQAYYTLIDRCHLTQAQLAERVGKSRAAVANAMRLLSLPEAIKQMIREGKLTEGHARAILVLDDEAAQLQMAARIVDDALSVRQAEQVTRRPRGRRLIPKRKLPVIAEAENELRQSLGTAVRIHHSLKGGRIEIEYYSDNDLTRLLELFQKLRN